MFEELVKDTLIRIKIINCLNNNTLSSFDDIELLSIKNTELFNEIIEYYIKYKF